MADDVHIDWVDGGDLSKVLRMPEVVAATRAKAEKVLAQAQATAPVKTGTYKRSLKIVVEHHAHRDTYSVLADVPYATYVESRHGTLARAMRAAK